MTLKTTFTIGLAVAALVFAAPAWGDDWYGDRQSQSDFWNYDGGVQIANTSPGLAPQDLAGLYSDGTSDLSRMLDAHQRVLSQGTVNSAPLAGHVDRYELDLQGGPTSVATTRTGIEIEWPQLGIGFGVGMAFVLGLILALRFTRSRPLAHG